MAKKKKRRRGGGSQPKKKGGTLMGMRRGFKNMADAATGNQKKKQTWVSTAITVALVLAALALLYRRFM